MKRFLIPLLIVCLALGVLKVQNKVESLNETVSFSQLVASVDPTVVYIEAHDYEGNRLWSGSGVIVRSDGLVLTAAHVVDGADKFKIVMQGGREFYSEESYTKSGITDIGLISIDCPNEKFKFSHLGNSDDLRKGDEVFIVGNPFGYRLRFTVTKGIVSGFGRDFDGYFGEKLLMQVDAQAWPGNSGGPVYNMDGQVIGILVGGYYGADGIGLTVPINTAKLILLLYWIK